MEQEFSITRTHATWKPRVIEDDFEWFRCMECGRIVLNVDGGVGPLLEGGGRNPQARLPYSMPDEPEPMCCGRHMERMPLLEMEEIPPELGLDYRIVGGFNNNAVECRWKRSAGYQVRWATLKTFTGCQTKYVTPKKWPPLLFALADEDAYAYCDESPCLECTFMCKRGFVLYVAFEAAEHRATVEGDGEAGWASASDLIPTTVDLAIARMPLTRFSPYYENKK